MSEPKFTPGPWKFRRGEFNTARENSIGSIRSASATEPAWYIATVEDAPEAESNAYLLEAAPDLYAALAQARRYVELAYECAFPDESENERVLAEIDAALAKARGGTGYEQA